MDIWDGSPAEGFTPQPEGDYRSPRSPVSHDPRALSFAMREAAALAETCRLCITQEGATPAFKSGRFKTSDLFFQT